MTAPSATAPVSVVRPVPDPPPLVGPEITTDFIRTALLEADANALRIALYQATGDEDLASMNVVQIPIRGGAYTIAGVGEEDRLRVIDKALAFLSDPDNRGPRSQAPQDDTLRTLMELLEGQRLDDRQFRLAKGEVGFLEGGREAHWRNGTPTEALSTFRVLMIGAGSSGIAMSIKLQHLGIEHLIIERMEAPTGVWHRHKYPGIRVDTNCLLYQFKFEKRYPWPEYFPTGQSIEDYMRYVAEKNDVLSRTHFGEEVMAATWDDDTALWTVRTRTSDGTEQTYTANVVISGAGLFTTPKMPDIPGMADFQGELVNTSEWPDDLTYAGKRVGVLGNGSTGTQVLPPLAKEAGHVTVFQRTPQWIIEVPTLRQVTSPNILWLLDAMPYYWNWAGYVQFAGTANVQGATVHDPAWMAAGGQISERNDKLRETLTAYINRKLESRPDLIAKVTPDWAPLARRLVVDSGWYDAILQDHVDLNTDGIERFVPEGALTKAGDTIPLDVMVISAGFDVSQYFYPTHYVGRDDTTLAQLWSKDGARAYLGITLPKFPNFYTIWGPNGQGRAGGQLQWLDVWTEYISWMLVEHIESGARSLEVRQDVFDVYNARMDERGKGQIYESNGQTGYFTNEFGRSGVQMSWDAHEFYDQLSPHHLSDYIAR